MVRFFIYQTLDYKRIPMTSHLRCSKHIVFLPQKADDIRILLEFNRKSRWTRSYQTIGTAKSRAIDQSTIQF